jgi:putative acetyltransferase
MHMQVRPAQADDRAQLLDLWERSVRTTHAFLEEGDVVALRPLVAKELASDAFDWWVLISTGASIGFLGFANDTIEGLFIDPDHHRQGGGRFLVEHAQSLSAGALAVDVNASNEAALRFYERLGFSVVGRSPTDSGGRPFPILHMKRADPRLLCRAPHSS